MLKTAPPPYKITTELRSYASISLGEITIAESTILALDLASVIIDKHKFTKNNIKKCTICYLGELCRNQYCTHYSNVYYDLIVYIISLLFHNMDHRYTWNVWAISSILYHIYIYIYIHIYIDIFQCIYRIFPFLEWHTWLWSYIYMYPIYTLVKSVVTPLIFHISVYNAQCMSVIGYRLHSFSRM